MFRYIVRRLLQMVLAFFGTTLIVYALMFAGQGDPIQALAGEKPVSASQRAVPDREVPPRQHGVGGSSTATGTTSHDLLHGDLGQSLTGRPIGDILAEAWPVTIKLGADRDRRRRSSSASPPASSPASAAAASSTTSPWC